MWQELRLKNREQNQFLGDMFEFFLDNGVKQSEGQFFTPIPITRFICMALPLKEMIRDKSELPRVLDFACGAGHFLTELAIQTKSFIEDYRQIEPFEFYKNIYGIEKESRLSKVAKVSAFMYGQEGINILPHDALDDIPDIKLESFDVLVANPPFAVEDFLETLSEEQREKYELFNTISAPGNKNIQCFFIERAKQLLAPNGVAGIIVPSSVLSNSDNTHIATREILLKYFDIVSIVELGGNTFSKTGTNTVVLFLRRKSQRPEPAEQYQNRVLDFFENWEDELKSGGGMYLDIDVVRKYCEHIEISFEDYQSLFLGCPSEQLLEYELFKEYRADFEKSTEIVNLKKRKSFDDSASDDQEIELNKRFLEYLQVIEKDKLYYFILAFNNPQKVLVVKSPTDNKKQKQFLGYEWSNAKGNEGLKYLSGSHVTPLFDPDKRDNPGKINYWIQQNFNGNGENFNSQNLSEYITHVSLVDLLDFSRKDFNKAFSLTPKKDIKIQTKWELVKLCEIAEIIAGQSPKSANYNEMGNGMPFYQGKKDFGDSYLETPTVWTTKITKESLKNDILMSVRAPVGDVNINPFDKVCIGRGLAAIRSNNKSIQKYLFEFIDQNKYLFKGNQGTTFESISTNDLREIKISLPPLEVQQQIVDECEAIDQSIIKAKEAIEQAGNEIEDKVNTTIQEINKTEKIGSLCSVNSGGTPSRNNAEYWVNGTIPWLKSEVCKEGNVYKANEYTALCVFKTYNNSSGQNNCGDEQTRSDI
jgi:type I restriction-modification system DNA methylase subunit